MNRVLTTALSLITLGLLTTAPAQTQIGNVTLTPAKAPAVSMAASYAGEDVPSGWSEIKGRVTGPNGSALRLPAGSEVRVTVLDTTAARILLDVSFGTTRLSTPYQLVYNPVRLSDTHEYVVRAEIVDARGKVLYRSADAALPSARRAALNLAVRPR
ncbi:YbaY family lipoprotein [Deinococcus aerophilus]|uniref:Uncharacterized protein n=1 Tax=Deinococcus aerophilus TaxID=522488 RepID=A0ABQ2GP06_9DEIO|nr:YbaY family lipoprotein [Deinococcus aerophilus]GGM04298.1 hypothetical protein GCM10010841_10780 [Deinococcus aerophilus]